ncbi:hypothetical protein GCM10010377_71150 [Streptomyces viridiviolaceus]|nr:hypothetical protein GCM10010377_71150 [Streptomyces viridiviolaceus]
MTRSRLDDLIAEEADADEERAGGGGTFFTELKADPDALGLDSLLAEVNKLQLVRGLRLPPELFADVSEKLVAAWRAGGEGVPLGPAGGGGAGAVRAAVDDGLVAPRPSGHPGRFRADASLRRGQPRSTPAPTGGWSQRIEPPPNPGRFIWDATSSGPTSSKPSPACCPISKPRTWSLGHSRGEH